MDLLERINQAVQQLDLDYYKVLIEGNHIKIIAVSDIFDSLSKVKSHQLVYKAVKPFLTSGEVHAVHVATYNNQKWEKDRILLGL